MYRRFLLLDTLWALANNKNTCEHNVIVILLFYIVLSSSGFISGDPFSGSILCSVAGWVHAFVFVFHSYLKAIKIYCSNRFIAPSKAVHVGGWEFVFGIVLFPFFLFHFNGCILVSVKRSCLVCHIDFEMAHSEFSSPQFDDRPKYARRVHKHCPKFLELRVIFDIDNPIESIHAIDIDNSQSIIVCQNPILHHKFATHDVLTLQPSRTNL